MSRGRFDLAFVALALATAPVAGQRADATPLAAATASSPTEFAMIGGIRELADGSVLVADPIDGLLRRFDSRLASLTTIGRTGSGPGEYKQPDGIFPLPGDSSLLVDLGNARLAAFDRQMRFGRTIPIMTGGEDAGSSSMTLMLVQGTDGAGNLYFRTMRPGMDSLPLLQFSRATGASREIARLKGPEVKTVTSGGANDQRQSSRQVPLSPLDGWAVSATGKVFIARVGDYHVEVVSPDGRITRGPVVAFRPVPIGAAEREEWTAQRARSGGLSIGMENNNGQVSVSMQRARPRQGDTDGLPWPDHKPAFDAGQLWVDSHDRLWVRREQSAGAAQLFDLFDDRGNPVGQVRLPSQRQIVGMGAGSLYLARFDADDLQYLERYALPTI